MNAIAKSLNTSTVNSRGIDVYPAEKQTKDWRMKQDWYHGGKSNECELHQRRLIEKITDYECAKTCKRLNLYSLEFAEILYPLKNDDGFEWTENFDGLQQFEDQLLYYNFKMVCDSGGAQTRSLREVYHFIHAQLEYLKHALFSNVYFINILDGDECYKHIGKFIHLKQKNKYKNVCENIFVGDTTEFIMWWENFSVKSLRYDIEGQN